MAKHERYSAYKDSASPWFGRIPSHWELKPLKYLASINDEKLADSTDGDEVIEYVDIGNVTLQQGICGSETLSFEKAPSRARRIVRDGDSIVSTVRTYLKAIAPIKQPPPNLIVSTGFAVIRPRALDPGYLSYHLQSSNFVEDVVSRSVGVSYPAINPTEIADIELVQPPLEEQQAIAAWLDERTARIDTLIAKKQRLIELLQEKRQAIISKAVTRGLDPHVKLKDSGIPWLGEVPEHWEVAIIKRGLAYLTDYEANGSFEKVKNNVTFADVDGYAWYVRATDLENERIADPNECRWVDESTYRFLSRTTLQAGDLLVAKRGEIGKLYLLPEVDVPCTLAPNLYLLRLNQKLHPEYAFYFLRSSPGQVELRLQNRSTTLGALYKDDCKEISMLYPPLEEQVAIIAEVKATTSHLDELISKATTATDRLQEYRSSLISAAVTGQIKVC